MADGLAGAVVRVVVPVDRVDAVALVRPAAVGVLRGLLVELRVGRPLVRVVGGVRRDLPALQAADAECLAARVA